MTAATISDPRLLDGERELMDHVFATECRRYLEFGLGGSTLLAIRHGAESVVAVDSDPDWVASVRDHPEIAPLTATGAVSVLHADIGPIGPWGAPRDQSQVASWPNYIRLPWTECARWGAMPNVVYVDGRFRVACCLSVALAAAGRGNDGEGPLVMLHDVRDDRPHYGEIFEFFDTVAGVNSLRVLRVRPDACPARLLAKFLEYQFDYR